MRPKGSTARMKITGSLLRERDGGLRLQRPPLRDFFSSHHQTIIPMKILMPSEFSLPRPRNAHRNCRRTLFSLAGTIVLSSPLFGAEMNATDLIKESEAAYAAVKMYVGTTTV